MGMKILTPGKELFENLSQKKVRKVLIIATDDFPKLQRTP